MKTSRNQYEWMIALRFLIRGRGQTLLIILGIAVGVSVQFFLSALISGLQVSLINNTVGSSPHLLVLPADRAPENRNNTLFSDRGRFLVEENREIHSWQQYVRDLSGDKRILRVAAVANGQGFIVRGNTVNAVAVKGLSPPHGPDIYQIPEKTISGTADLRADSALLGERIARRLTLAVGDKFFLRNDRGDQVVMRVGGIFDLGAAAGNELLVTSIDLVRSFFAIHGVSAIEAQVRDVFAAADVARDFARQYDRVKIESWQEKNRDLLTALRSQSTSSVTIQFFVILSISLAIASVLGIAAVQKQRQLGILKAMGTTNRSASRIFIIQGIILGAAGSLLGILMGLLMGYGFVTGTRAVFDLEVNARTLLTPFLLAMLAAVTASTIPARRAAKLSPIEVIRNG